MNEFELPTSNKEFELPTSTYINKAFINVLTKFIMENQNTKNVELELCKRPIIRDKQVMVEYFVQLKINGKVVAEENKFELKSEVAINERL